jgi:aryl-alcohol dehydrogenase-like predicted oxidoreductase
MMEFRRLGRSAEKVSPLGLGMARIAGLGWREHSETRVSEQVVRAAVKQIQVAVDAGINFFDTADNYGAGLSEHILGRALQGRRDRVLVATKFGEDPIPNQEDPWSLDAGIVQRSCEASLRRLGFEHIDLYLLHRRDYPLERASEILEALEDLLRAGKICYYGWSTDDLERAHFFASGEHCTAIEHRLNVFNDPGAMLELCREHDLASLNRVPLLMGVLSGRWTPETQLGEEDRRAVWFEQDDFADVLACANAIEPYLTCDGRTYVQGALGWIWARSPLAIPLPGFRNMEQLQGLLDARVFGPLPDEVMPLIAEVVRSAGISR